MSELTLEGVLTVEKFLQCSSCIKYIDRKYDLTDLSNRHVYYKHLNYNTSKNRHSFIGDYITDIKITNLHNLKYISITNEFDEVILKYDTPGAILEILDFQGIRAVGSGLWLKYEVIHAADPVTGTLTYRSLYPLTYMGDIDTDMLFCQLRDGRFIACQNGKIYTNYLNRTVEYLKAYANHNYESTHLMYKWPIYDYVVNTFEPDHLRVPWITVVSCEYDNNKLIISVKSENAGRFEQLAVATCSKWEKLLLKGEVDKQLSDYINQKINDFYKPKIALYNLDKETEPLLVKNDDSQVKNLRDIYKADKKYLQELKEMCNQQNPTQPINKLLQHGNLQHVDGEHDNNNSGEYDVLF